MNGGLCPSCWLAPGCLVRRRSLLRKVGLDGAARGAACPPGSVEVVLVECDALGGGLVRLVALAL